MCIKPNDVGYVGHFWKYVNAMHTQDIMHSHCKTEKNIAKSQNNNNKMMVNDLMECKIGIWTFWKNTSFGYA
jgi:hypothetical protein